MAALFQMDNPYEDAQRSNQAVAGMYLAPHVRAQIAELLLKNKAAEAELPYVGEKARLGNELMGAQIPGVQATTAHTQGLTEAGKYGLDWEKAQREGLLGPGEGTILERVQRFLNPSTAAPAQAPQTTAPMIDALKGQAAPAEAPAPAPAPEANATLLDTLRRTNTAKALSSKEPLAAYMAGEQGVKMEELERKLIQELSSEKWNARRARVRGGNTSSNQAMIDFQAENPDISLLGDNGKALLERAFKAPAQPGMAFLSTVPPKSGVLDHAAQRIHKRQSTVSEEINKGKWLGSTAMEVHDALVEKVVDMEPDFSEARTEAGMKFAANPSTKRFISSVDNARSTAKRILELSKKAVGTPSPLLNEMINKFNIQLGDVTAAGISVGELTGAEEFSSAFQRAGVGSETTRTWASKLGKSIYQNPAQAQVSLNEIIRAFDRSRKATDSQAEGYLSKPGYEYLPDEDGVIVLRGKKSARLAELRAKDKAGTLAGAKP